MPVWLPWRNVGVRDCSRHHVLRGSHLIRHWSAVNVNRRRECKLLLHDEIGELC